MYLVLLETSGNQSYIFSTNRLRENVGASELTYLCCTDWARDAAKTCGASEVLVSSGRAYFSTDSPEAAESLIGAVTLRALREAPGLDLTGACVEWDEGIHDAVGRAHRRLAEIRGDIPGPESRFQRVPPAASCQSSGLPGYGFEKVGGDEQLLSRVSSKKRGKSEHAYHRLDRLMGMTFSDDLEDLAGEGERLAVIHADGNGLGRVFLEFDKHSGAKDDAEYIRLLNEFSQALDECAVEACKKAFGTLTREADGSIRAFPLVMGGDDLTCLCLGSEALTFTKTYLEEYARLTEQSDIISKRIVGSGVTACAGVAIVKRHFPFSAAYDLAEELVRSAKQVKKKYPDNPPCALDFHVVYDQSPSSLDGIRGDGDPHLHGGPYLVTEKTDEWAEAHSFEVLRDRAERLREDQAGKDPLPRTQVHALREALFSGVTGAEAYYNLAKPRCKGLKDVFGETLFTHDGDSNITTLIDAIEASELMK